VDADPPPLGDRTANRLARRLNRAEKKGIVAGIGGSEERPSPLGVSVAPPHEDARGRLREAEHLGERASLWAGARTDRPCALLHVSTVTRASDGVPGRGYPPAEMPETNYASGDEYVVEFLGYRFGFNALDFEQRVSAAAVKLGLVEPGDLDPEEAADLVELAAEARITEPRSLLGDYLVRHWERVALVNGESLVYWLRKLVFRSAWLDHRVKENLLEVSWDERTGDFDYRDPNGGRALLELAPVPSWHKLQFRR
jgi:hypothetical protein